MWDTVSHISTGFALAAFIVAGAITGYRFHLRNRLHILETVPAADRTTVLVKEINSFNIDAKRLTPLQQFELATTELRLRSTKLLYTALVIIIVAIISGGVAAYSLSIQTQQPTLSALPDSPLVVDTTSTSNLRNYIDHYELKDVAVCNNDIYLLTIFDLQDRLKYVDPHGNEFPQAATFIIHIGDNYAHRATVTTARVGHGTIDCVSDNLRVFLSEKVDDGTYLMNGTIYTRRKADLVDLRADPQFERKNWGWFPQFDKDDLQFFSYDGYRKIINNTDAGPETPVEASKSFKIYQIKHSDGILPNTHSDAVSRIVARVLNEPNPIEVVGHGG